jgi:hypothetical protein
MTLHYITCQHLRPQTTLLDNLVDSLLHISYYLESGLVSPWHISPPSSVERPPPHTQNEAISRQAC